MEDELIEIDDGTKTSETERFCALSRQRLPISRLVRFVVGPEDVVVPDIRNRLPGRGVWLTGTAEMVTKGASERIFARAFRRAVTLPEHLGDEVERLLKQDALMMLSMANKAGSVITGFAKVAEARPPVLALLQALDGSAAEKIRLRGHLRGHGPKRTDPAVIELFDATELALSLGREHVIHAALLSTEVGRATLERVSRYGFFRHPDFSQVANADVT